MRDDPQAHARLTAAGVIALVVLVSILIGAAGDRLLLSRGRPGPMGPPMGRDPGGERGPGPGGGPGGIGDSRIRRELQLTVAQERAIDSVMRGERSEFDAARDVVRARIDSVMSRTRQQIDSILTPAQRERLNAMRGDERRGPPPDGADGRGPGGPGGPPRP